MFRSCSVTIPPLSSELASESTARENTDNELVLAVTYFNHMICHYHIAQSRFGAYYWQKIRTCLLDPLTRIGLSDHIRQISFLPGIGKLCR